MNLGELIFSISVKSDAAAKNLESTKKNIDAVARSAKTTGESISKHLGGAFGSLIKTALPIATVTGAVVALSKAQSDLVAVGKQGDVFGVDSRHLIAWGRAAESLGFSSENAKSAIIHLERGLQEAALTGRGQTAGMLQYLGIRMRNSNGEMRNGADIMQDLAKRFQGMSQQKALHLGQMLGLSPDTIALLRSGKALTKELADAYANAASPEAIAQATRFDESMIKLRQSGEDLARNLFVAVAPALIEVLNAVKPVARFLADNPFFAVAGAAAFSFRNTLTALIPAFKMVGSVGIGVFKALGAVISKNPIIFAITSIVAVLTDLYDWFNGAPSAFGTFLKWLGIGDEALQNFKKAVQGIKNIFGFNEDVPDKKDEQRKSEGVTVLNREARKSEGGKAINPSVNVTVNAMSQAQQNPLLVSSVPQSIYNSSNQTNISNRNVQMDARNEITVNVNGGPVNGIREAVAGGVNDGMSQYNSLIVGSESGVLAK